MRITKKVLLLTLFQGLVCQRWEFPTQIVGLSGSCVEIPCTFRPRVRSTTSSTVWYLYSLLGYPQIFNSQRSSSASKDYRGRTSLVPGENSCSLRIDPVRREDGGESYYPGIVEDQDTNAWTQQDKMTLWLHVTDSPNLPELTRIGEMVEGRPEKVSCSVDHTCGSSPPSLRFNKAGQTERRSEDLSGGNWREILTITYIPSHEDDNTEIQCTATYHNGGTSQMAEPLIIIRFAPKDVTVILSTDRAISEGSEVILTCSSRSHPPPHTYEWYRGKSKMKLRPEVQKIRVQNVNRDTEPFSCVAINDAGRGESPPTPIPVQYAPKDVTVTLSKNEELLEGSDVILTCSSRSNPPPHRYEWYRGKSKIKLNSKEKDFRVLNISKDTEPYSCAAINYLGRGESPPIELPVQYAATGVQVIVLPPTEGATELKCNFMSSNPNVTHYTWMKDGNSLINKTEQILVLDSNEDRFGSYSCIAHNTAGSSTSAKLEMKDSTVNEKLSGDEDSPNLLLILGVLAGVILLLFLVIIVFFYTRRKRKPTAPLSPIHGEIPSHFPSLRDQDETLVQEHQYGNIQVNPKVHPRSQRSPYSSPVSGDQSHAIYTNEEFLHSGTDIEYSTIAHTHHGRRQDLIDGDGYGDNVSYATIKH